MRRECNSHFADYLLYGYTNVLKKNTHRVTNRREKRTSRMKNIWVENRMTGNDKISRTRT